MPIAKQRQNRRQRKKNQKIFRSKSKRAKKDWGEWIETPTVMLSKEAIGYTKDKKLLKDLKSFWANNYLSVQLSEIETEIGLVKRLGIRRNDESANISWSEKQRIKNELCGEDAIAVEVFPVEKDLIDQANIFWLWILPDGYKLPFSLKD